MLLYIRIYGQNQSNIEQHILEQDRILENFLVVKENQQFTFIYNDSSDSQDIKCSGDIIINNPNIINLTINPYKIKIIGSKLIGSRGWFSRTYNYKILEYIFQSINYLHKIKSLCKNIVYKENVIILENILLDDKSNAYFNIHINIRKQQVYSIVCENLLTKNKITINNINIVKK